jgi:hypothetical protein
MLEHLLGRVWESLSGKADVPAAEIETRVALAWPEITRLRLEREAELEADQVMSGMNSMLTGTIPQNEAAGLLYKASRKAHKLNGEADILEASCKLSTLIPIFLNEQSDANRKGKKHAAISSSAGMVPGGVDTSDKLDKSGGVGVEMVDVSDSSNLGMSDREKLDMADLVDSGYWDFMCNTAINDYTGEKSGAKVLRDAINQVEALLPDEAHKGDDLSAAGMDKLKKIVADLAPTMILLHAMNPTICANQLEKLLVASQRVLSGDSTSYFLEAIITEIKPQVDRLIGKEDEIEVVAKVIDDMHGVLNSGDVDGTQVAKIVKIFEEYENGLHKAHMGHKARYKAWLSNVPEFNGLKAVPSLSPELSSLSSIVTTAETVIARGSDDLISAANAEIRKVYRPTAIRKGVDAEFCRCLVEMEKYIYGDIDEQALEKGINGGKSLEDGIHGGLELCAKLHKDKRINVTKLMSAFDEAKIIVLHKSDPDFYRGDEERQDRFKSVVFDAWSNVVTLQAEQKANGLSKEMVNIVDSLNSGDMTMDTFTAHVENHRHVLNELIEQDKILHNEKMLLSAVTELQDINDVDKINIAVRETESQLSNLQVGQRCVEGLKKMYDVLCECRDDRPSGKTKCQALVDEYADVVVKLGGLDDNALPMEMCLVTLQRIALDQDVTNAEIELLINTVVRPQVLRNCSNPSSEELKTLMVEVTTLVNNQSAAVLTADVIAAQDGAKHGAAKVKKAVGSHRDRLAYRQRMALQESIGIDKLVLLKAETHCGAEWAGFYVEGVKLKHVAYLRTSQIDERSECQKAYDAFDMDQDKVITIDEIIKYLLSVKPDERPLGLQDINPFKKAKMRKLLKTLDTDQNGTLSFEEFETFWDDQHSL